MLVCVICLLNYTNMINKTIIIIVTSIITIEIIASIITVRLVSKKMSLVKKTLMIE